MRHYLIIAATVGAVLSTSSQAQAATATGNLNVSATVLSSCGVLAAALPFGNYSPAQTTRTTNSALLTVTCTLGTPYNIGLSAGGGTGATLAARKMSSGSNLLTYSLYQDSAASTVWGDQIGTNTVASSGTGLPQLVTVYGAVPAQQNVPTGLYSDTVTVTLTY